MLESLNLPFISNPILTDGMALVDGGILNNLPADVLVDRGADFVLGVDVSTGITQKFGRNFPGMSPSEMRPAGTLETLFRVLEVMGTGTAELRSPAINMLIQPDTSRYSFTDFTRGFELAEIGEELMARRTSELQHEINELLRFRRD